VLVDEQDAPWKTDKLRREAHKLMDQAKVRRTRLYDACLTYLATSGVPDVVVSAWAGHADLNFTKHVYIHPTSSNSARQRTNSTNCPAETVQLYV
jgi:integrase